MKKTFMIFAIIALLVANVSTARAEENFGFSIAGVEVSDENCDEIGKVLRWSNFLLSGDVTYNRTTITLTLDNADIRFPFGKNGIREEFIILIIIQINKIYKNFSVNL